MGPEQVKDHAEVKKTRRVSYSSTDPCCVVWSRSPIGGGFRGVCCDVSVRRRCHADMSPLPTGGESQGPLPQRAIRRFGNERSGGCEHGAGTGALRIWESDIPDSERTPVEIDPTRMCELLVGLPEVDILGVVDEVDGPLRVHVQCRQQDRWCRECGGWAESKDRAKVELVDLPAFGRQTQLVWHKYRWECVNRECEAGSWTQGDDRIGVARMLLTDRAGRWACEQVGKHARSVNEIAGELGCDWHTVNTAVTGYGTALIDDPDRYGTVTALGVDEVLFVRVGDYRTQEYSTQLVDVNAGQLLDVVEGRSAKAPKDWLAKQDQDWRDDVQYATLDLSATYRSALDAMLPDAVQVADPFHVVKLANTKLDECRRRVQNQTLGHRGRKTDPLYRCRRLLTKADERLTETGTTKLVGLLQAGDPDGEVATAWQAKESVRDIYTHTNPEIALHWTERLAADLTEPDQPVEVRSLGRTLKRWKDQIVAWHRAHVSNGPTEAVNNLIKRVKRAAYGFTNFTNYRIRSLLYAGKPNWDLLPTIKPR